MRYKYSKYVPILLDELDMDELMSKLSDLLLSSGFGNPGRSDETSDRTMQALHDAILEALFNGGVLRRTTAREAVRRSGGRQRGADARSSSRS